jgi:hypothetical protein
MQLLHFDEAKNAAISLVREWAAAAPVGTRVMLVADLFGKLRLVLWPTDSLEISPLTERLTVQSGIWWTGDVFNIPDLDPVTSDVFESTWNSEPPDETKNFRFVSRHRNRTAWFAAPIEPLWPAPGSAPPVIVFYSFKGGLGRTTVLASFAIQRARLGDRVCVVDFDLDSPGVGRLLSADKQGLTAKWGVVDFLLENSLQRIPLEDYLHHCNRIASTGQILVFPAGSLNEGYADKLARTDLEEEALVPGSGLAKLLTRIREEIEPQWILLDARTGISEPGGQLLSGIAHLHVLLGSSQEQSWQGLSLAIERLGSRRVRSGLHQAELVIVQAMVPVDSSGKDAQDSFAGRAEEEFDLHYYVQDEEEDRFWNLGDKGSQDAPHVPIAVEYDPKLAIHEDIAEVADTLCTGSYLTIADRIASRFLPENEG